MSSFLRKKKVLLLKFIIPFLFLLDSSNVYSQEIETLMLEPELNFSFSTKSRWSFSLGLANRGILLEKINAESFSENQTKHLEVNQWTNYSLNDLSSLSLGIRYRIRDIFDVPNENEFRIIQQFYSGKVAPFEGWHHRGRFEQRYRPSIMIFRLRYQLEYWKPLNKNSSLGFNIEALYNMSRKSKPAPEQRISIFGHHSFWENWEVKLGLEFRMDNYIRQQENSVFVLTWFTYNL